MRSEGLPFLKKNVLYFHRTKVIVPEPLAARVAGLALGPINAGCEYRPGGLVLVSLLGKQVEIAPYVAPAPAAARVSREDDPQTRADLDALGEQSLPCAAHELIRGLDEMIEQGNAARAASLFPLLMAAATRNPSMLVDPPSMAAIWKGLPANSRKGMQGPWLDWLMRHREVGTVSAPDILVPDIAFADWPDELLVLGLGWRIARKEDNAVLRALLDELRRRSPGDPRVAAAEAVIEHAKGEAGRRKAKEAEVRATRAREQMAAPPNPGNVELAFKIKLPRELTRAFQRLEVQPFPGPLLRDLVARAETLRAQFLAEDAAPAFLPLLEEGGAMLGLYLTFPRPDGDFAVLALRDGGEPEIVSETSADWLTTRSRIGSSRN